jgi:hypothetical protein
VIVIEARRSSFHDAPLREGSSPIQSRRCGMNDQAHPSDVPREDERSRLGGTNGAARFAPIVV